MRGTSIRVLPFKMFNLWSNGTPEIFSSAWLNWYPPLLPHKVHPVLVTADIVHVYRRSEACFLPFSSPEKHLSLTYISLFENVFVFSPCNESHSDSLTCIKLWYERRIPMENSQHFQSHSYVTFQLMPVFGIFLLYFFRHESFSRFFSFPRKFVRSRSKR